MVAENRAWEKPAPGKLNDINNINNALVNTFITRSSTLQK